MYFKDPEDEIFESGIESSSDLYDDESTYPLGI